MLIRVRHFTIFPFALLLLACAPSPQLIGASIQDPRLETTQFVTADGVILPYRVWPAEPKVEAVVVGLHGFNDYSNSFADLGDYLQRQHISTYAFDQRGFGGAPGPGSWAGTDTYVEDLREFCRLVRQRHPSVPLYVIGESMGGAIAMVAFTSGQAPDADGVILSAPAVWARKTMPWYQRVALFVGAHLFPWASFTGEGIEITPSDNRDMLIALGRDPLVIKATKVEAMYGLTNLMDEALSSAERYDEPTFVLIGELDEIVPNHASALMLSSLPAEAAAQRKVAVYEQGYHMLWRDLHGAVVMQDIAAWIKNHSGNLPSKEDQVDLGRWLKANLN